MMLIVLDKNAEQAALKVPDKLKFKQLLELAQMICSCSYSDVYKKIPQGKKIQEWIMLNQVWTKTYAWTLYKWCCENINMKNQTRFDFITIISGIPVSFCPTCNAMTAVFRYSKDYTNTTFATDTELSIEEAVTEYERYMEWKNEQF